MRAAAYYRISADPRGTAEGVARQREDCRARAVREGWTLDERDEFEDNDVSASTNSRKKRPNYDEMLRRANAGEYDVILSYSNSRLTRRPMELEDLIKLHDRTGVQLRTCVSGDDDLSTADGRRNARIRASIDAGEAEQTAERARRAKAAKRARGEYIGGARRFGFGESMWITNSDGKQILSAKNRNDVNETEAELIRQGAALILAAGKGRREVVRQWNASGVKGVRGGTFDRDRVKQILSDPGNVPAILSQETYDQIKALMSEQSEHYTRGSAPVHFLAGVAQCGVCDKPLISSSKRGAPSYKCRGFHMDIQAADAERVVSTAVTAWYFSGRRDPDERPSSARTIEAVQGERAALIAERAEVSEDVAAGLLDRQAMRPRLTAIRDALAVLDAELENLRQSDAHEAMTEAAVSEAEAILTAGLPADALAGPAPFSRAVAIRQRWDAMSVESKKKLLASFRVVVHRAEERGYGAKRVSVHRNGVELTAGDDELRDI